MKMALNPALGRRVGKLLHSPARSLAAPKQLSSKAGHSLAAPKQNHRAGGSILIANETHSREKSSHCKQSTYEFLIANEFHSQNRPHEGISRPQLRGGALTQGEGRANFRRD
jgi:hypothetical protein